MEVNVTKKLESPKFVRISFAAAMTLGISHGRFLRDAKLYCINLLLTYDNGCIGRCAYCGLSRLTKANGPWIKHNFIRVDWPTVALDEVLSRMSSETCSHVERVCVSMITNRRAREDLIAVVKRVHGKTSSISALITPTIIDKEWLFELKNAGADMVGIAVDAATPELFERLRGREVRGPHTWEKYWKTLAEAAEIFGQGNVGVHLIVGLGESEKEMVNSIQRAHNLGAMTHLFSFFPEERSAMQNWVQPLISKYRRIQLARYLINHGVSTLEKMTFDEYDMLRDYGVEEETLNEIVNRGQPFMTSGCRGKTMENACNRPFANCTPYQAHIGKLRNYPFPPLEKDIETIRCQLLSYSRAPTRVLSLIQSARK